MTTFTTARDIPATAQQIFAAISDPLLLARWWGPAGFTNTFSAFEFKPGGRWTFVMHGPDGRNYPNENRFEIIETPHRVVIAHVLPPLFRLTISLTPSAGGTTLAWAQAFESAEVASQVAHMVVPANEQNLDRLTAVVLGQLHGQVKARGPG
jgi:uncharacterized protein YndB with AHSA1/START domain